MLLGVLESFALKAGSMRGLAVGATYGMLALPIVLAHRTSRVIAFAHAGIATASAYIYWYLVTRELWSRGAALLAVIVLGVMLGALFGAIVSGRMATWPRISVTVFLLGLMLTLTGIVGSIWPGALYGVPSPFGFGAERVLDYVMRHHEIATISLLLILVATLSFVLYRTKLGIQLRAIADDIECAEMVGIPVPRISVALWTVAGGLAGFAGVMVAADTALTEDVVFYTLTLALTGAVLGGFESLTLVLGGCLILGQLYSHMSVGTFGDVPEEWRQFVVMGVLFGGVFLVACLKPSHFKLKEA